MKGNKLLNHQKRKKKKKNFQTEGQYVCISVLSSPNICSYSDINRRTRPSARTARSFREPQGKSKEHDSQSHDDRPEHKSLEALYLLIFISTADL